MTESDNYNNLLNKVDLLIEKKNNAAMLKLFKKSIKYNHLQQITSNCFNYLIIVILLVICFMFYFSRQNSRIYMKQPPKPYNVGYINNRPSPNIEFLKYGNPYNNHKKFITTFDKSRESDYYQNYRISL